MPKRTIASVTQEVEAVLQEMAVPIDQQAYANAGRSPRMPIWYDGEPRSQLAFLARDLGREEVSQGRPLCGPSGQAIRGQVAKVLGSDAHAMYLNTVPFKPPFNKAYPQSVRHRFREYVLWFLTHVWQGRYLMTLGKEAFDWFLPYVPRDGKAAFHGLWSSGDWQGSKDVTLTYAGVQRQIVILPLPHPSGRSRYRKQFPELLERRLNALDGKLKAVESP
jgi:uracil-DNA glycosylase